MSQISVFYSYRYDIDGQTFYNGALIRARVIIHLASLAHNLVQCFSDLRYANQVLEWKAEHKLDPMCEDALQSHNPFGFKEGY